jgi:uncharacterized protein YegL
MSDFDEMKMDFDADDLDFGWGEDEVQEAPGEEIEEEDFLECMEPSKKSMSIFFLIDTSGSMEGSKIGTVNGTMEELLPELIGIGGAETDISIAVMEYSTSCKWITPKPVRIEEYQHWNRLKGSGLTAMGAAFKELSSKLSRSAFMNKPSLSYAPVIFLMTDGAPTDDYKEGLRVLQKNNWFKYGLKIAVGIGSKPDMNVLREFTGCEELAVQAHGANQLKDLITLLAVTSSQIGSTSMSLTDEGREKTAEDVAGDKQKRLIEEVQKATDIMSTDPSDVDFDEGW